MKRAIRGFRVAPLHLVRADRTGSRWARAIPRSSLQPQRPVHARRGVDGRTLSSTSPTCTWQPACMYASADTSSTASECSWYGTMTIACLRKGQARSSRATSVRSLNASCPVDRRRFRTCPCKLSVRRVKDIGAYMRAYTETRPLPHLQVIVYQTREKRLTIMFVSTTGLARTRSAHADYDCSWKIATQ